MQILAYFSDFFSIGFKKLKKPYPNLYSAGVDFEKANEKGLKTIWALSLPGKVAPVSAAEFIKDTIYNIINELGV